MNRKFIATILAIALALPVMADSSHAFLSLSEINIDWSCVDFKIIGVCVKRRKGKTIVAPKVQYWWPRALIEAVPKPGQSLVADAALFTEGLKIALTGSVSPSGAAKLGGAAGQRAIEQTDMSSVVTGEQYLINNEKFMEAHVFTFKPPEPCDGSYKFYLSYASEYDAVNWRTGVIDGLTMGIWERVAPLIPGLNTANCLGLNISGFVGCWGPIYPRQGWVMQSSDPVVSALLGYRAADLAAYVYHTFPYGTSLKDKMQLAYPRKKGCMPIGTHPIKWQVGANKPGAGGKYLWVYWKEVECCLW